MKTLHIALLGTAALFAVTMNARADDMSDLRAQIEGLNSRIAQLESTPSMPAGYQLLTISEADAIIVPAFDDKGYGKKATNIAVLPTADVPASTNIQWSGFVRAAVVYKDVDFDAADTTTVFDKNSIDIVSRAGIKVVGTTDTAVGEVGVRVALLAVVETFGGINRSHDSSVATDGYWGWWKVTPELELAGGVAGSLADSSNAFKDRCTCYYQDTGGDFGNGDPSQIRLTYKSGDISFAIAVEDYDNLQVAGSSKSSFGGAGELKWSGDGFGFDLNAGFWDTSAAAPADADWTVNLGAKFDLGDFASIGLAAGMGEGMDVLKGGRHGLNDEFMRGSMFMGISLSDEVEAEFGVAYTDHDTVGQNFTVAGGLYYKPVSQLVIGLEGSYSETYQEPATATDRAEIVAAMVANYSF